MESDDLMVKELECYKARYANIINHYKQKVHFSSSTGERLNKMSSLSTYRHGCTDLDTNTRHCLEKNVISENTESTENTENREKTENTENVEVSLTTAYKMSIYDSVVSIDEYWLMQSVSRWWWSQSRENVYNYFDTEFWVFLQYLEECMTELDASSVSKKTVNQCGDVINFLDELLPSLVYLKTIYPTYSRLNDLVQDIVELLYIYYSSIERQLNHLSTQFLVEEMII